jgi:hypothetical protein
MDGAGRYIAEDGEWESAVEGRFRSRRAAQSAGRHALEDLLMGLSLEKQPKTLPVIAREPETAQRERHSFVKTGLE